MPHWLYKTEPSSWSWSDQLAEGEKGAAWTGVRNHMARRNLEAMRIGDRGFFYHSTEGKAIVGIVEVVREYYPDPTDPAGKFGVVDLKAIQELPRPVTLEAIKAEPSLAAMSLVKNARLSVQPVTEAEWSHVCHMGGL